MLRRSQSFASYLTLLVVGTLTFSSCQQRLDDEPQTNTIGRQDEQTLSLLSFRSKEDLAQAVKEGVEKDSYGKSLPSSLLKQQVQSLRSMEEGTEAISYEDLVPEKNLRSLLNSRGEIQVGDSVYCITFHGTFSAHKSELAKLRAIVGSFSLDQATRIDDKTLQIGGVRLYETFAGVDFSDVSSNPEAASAGEEDESAQSVRGINPRTGLDENIPLPNLDSFTKERGRRITWTGKILQSISFRKSHTAQLPDNSRRRLNCAVYDYDYGFFHSIGITAKIQKKMWYGGWGKVKYWSAGTILVGYRYALVRYPYPENLKSKVEEMLNFRRIQKDAITAEADENFANFLPRPAWFKRELFNGTSPIYAITKKKLTFEDVLKEAKPLIRQLVKSQAQAAWVEDPSLLYDPVKEKLTFDQLLSQLDFWKRAEFAPMQVPLFAEDGIYVLYKGGWLPNKQDQSEIDIPLDEGMGTFVLHLNARMENGVPQVYLGRPNVNVNAGWRNNNVPTISNASLQSGAIKLEYGKEKRAGTLIGGDFFAIAYGGGWVGYNLTW